MTLMPLLDMSTSTLSKAFKMTDKSTISRMSTKIETISLFNVKASPTSKMSNAKKNIVFYSKQPQTTIKASINSVITPSHSNPQTLSSLMTRNAFNSSMNLIGKFLQFY